MRWVELRAPVFCLTRVRERYYIVLFANLRFSVVCINRKFCFLSGFDNSLVLNTSTAVRITIFVGAPMSLASVHPIDMHNRDHSGLSTRGSSLEELHSYFPNSDTAVLSIEELRLQLNSCFTCGVSWHEDHVSLDCRECGGYSLERPCPMCDGRCSSMWKRDLTMSHASGKARWEGECGLRRQLATEEEARLCSRLEKLGASS
ncbi:hypothetical protein C0J52_26103 [Blattella germanica]|nr:hypothetical protein C0J52_26103 [Blattella germanica]